MSPASQGGFLTTGPQGSPWIGFLIIKCPELSQGIFALNLMDSDTVGSLLVGKAHSP